MSKDKVDISIPTTFKSINKNIGLWNKRRVYIEGGKVESRIDYWIKKEDIYIKYYNFSTYGGRLIISLNINKLLREDNTTSIITNGMEKVKEILEGKVGDIIDFAKIDGVKTWGVSREETFIDVVIPVEVARALFKVLLKTKSRRKKIDDRYADGETIYYYSGTNRKKSNCLYKIYNKVREAMFRDRDMDCPQNYIVIRFEAKNGRTKIVRVIRNIRNDIIKMSVKADELYIKFSSTFNKYDDLNMQRYNEKAFMAHVPIRDYGGYLWREYDYKDKDVIYGKCESGSVLLNNLSEYATADDIFDIRYQNKMLVDFMKDISMDKEKLTRKELLKRINDIFSTPKTIKTAKEVIRFLNGERKNKPINERSIEAYKKKILNTGIHYIYSDIYIPAIDVHELKKCIVYNNRFELCI